MSLTYGFYNSLNGDRRYSAEQISNIFDGIVMDGVFASIGTAFAVTAAGGRMVNVGIGRAWFNHTWTYNDAIMPLELPQADVLLNRVDAVVLEVDATDSVRSNAIKVITGKPASAAQPPVMRQEERVHQYPLCHIARRPSDDQVRQADITPLVGSKATPFVTGILQVISLEELLGKWQDELNRFIELRENDVDEYTNRKTQEIDQWIDAEETDIRAWFEQIKSELLAEQKLLDQWVDSEQSDFLAWYNRMKGQLDADPAGHLQLAIDKEEIRRILVAGLDDGSKTFSEDGSVIIATASDGRTLTKTFTNHFSTMTAVLKSPSGAEVAKLVKTFDSSGKLIDTVVTYF